jgi:hypothetical protein
VATMSPAMVNDGILSFLLLLVLLLAIMLGAVIRMPPPGRGETEEDQPAPPVPVWTAPARARPTTAQASATSALSPLGRAAGRPGKTRYTGRHVAGRRAGRSPIRLAGSPPWGPAPQPPGQRP